MTTKKAPNLRKEGKVKSYFLVDHSLISVEEGFNVREETPELLEHIEWLKTDIRDKGEVKKPVTVRKIGNEYKLTDGHCRVRAVKELATKGRNKVNIPVPVIVEDPKKYSETDRLAALINDNSGKPLTIPEQATVAKRLIDSGLTPKETAKKISKSVGHVQQLLKYLETPEEVQRMVVDGTISPSLAITTAYEDGEAAPEVLEEAKEIAESEGKKKVTKKYIDKAKEESSDKPTVSKVISVPKKVTPRGQNLFSAVYKYAEEILGDNDDLSNYLVDTCEELDKKIQAYELELNPPKEDD